MTNPAAFTRRSRGIPTLPRGDVLGTYDTYLEAQRVVDRLAKAEFDVRTLAIVGNDLKTVEQVTGKQSWAKASLGGAITGAWLGLFLGLLLFLFTPPTEQVIGYTGAALLMGAGFGMVFGIVSYSIRRRSRDFTSMHQVIASNYQVIVDPQLTAKAQDLLSRAAN